MPQISTYAFSPFGGPPPPKGPRVGGTAAPSPPPPPTDGGGDVWHNSPASGQKPLFNPGHKPSMGISVDRNTPQNRTPEGRDGRDTGRKPKEKDQQPCQHTGTQAPFPDLRICNLEVE